MDALSLDSSNVKAFLLLQAHMTRLTLPNTDYLTDTKSVLDQTIRILQVRLLQKITQFYILNLIAFAYSSVWDFGGILQKVQAFFLFNFAPH